MTYYYCKKKHASPVSIKFSKLSTGLFYLSSKVKLRKPNSIAHTLIVLKTLLLGLPNIIAVSILHSYGNVFPRKMTEISNLAGI